jgi:hypothetical protein
VLLVDISALCLKVIEELLEARNKESSRYEEGGGQTLMLTLQVLNKVSLVLDQFASAPLLANLKAVVEGARRLPNFGMGAVLDLIESNIYRKVYSELTPAFE